MTGLKSRFMGVSERVGKMAAKYCDIVRQGNEEKRRWIFGQDFVCDGDFENCRHRVKIGKQEYCGYCPPRVALHQVIKGQAGCLWCVYYTKDIDCNRCLECLSAATRIHHKSEVMPRG